MLENIPVSLLELGNVKQGQNYKQAFEDIITHAQLAETLGFKRVWVAEHHNMPTISTAATAIIISHIAEHTKNIRVGSGGIMLPNHTPLAIAEQFGTLNILFNNRIDLGLGRAPGTDQLTAAALRRDNLASSYRFPTDIKELQEYLSNTNEDAKVRALPGEGQNIPIWILGSSTDSAYLAAELGLPYAFASHFAPAQLYTAIAIYRKNFKPSVHLDKPYVMAAANIIVAETDALAEFYSTSFKQLFLGILTNNRSPLPPPVEQLPEVFEREDVQHALHNMTSCSFIGSKETVTNGLTKFVNDTNADELIITNYIYDKEARLTSLKLLAEIMKG